LRLVEILPPAQIRIGLRATDKRGAIAELAGLLPLPDEAVRAEVVRAVLEREVSASTGIGRGVAIPHARAAAVPRLMAALGTAPAGLEFDAVDGLPCRIFLLLVSGPADAGPHGEALVRVACLLNREEAKRALAEARTPEDVLEVLRRDE
jgi:mannitol/fructose-specific phosphotransferase system IIA component (Ntr-type)